MWHSLVHVRMVSYRVCHHLPLRSITYGPLSFLSHRALPSPPRAHLLVLLMGVRAGMGRELKGLPSLSLPFLLLLLLSLYPHPPNCRPNLKEECFHHGPVVPVQAGIVAPDPAGDAGRQRPVVDL